MNDGTRVERELVDQLADVDTIEAAIGWALDASGDCNWILEQSTRRVWELVGEYGYRAERSEEVTT